jgi:hypothetical protein
MKFGSWTYDGFQLDLAMKEDGGGDLTSFITNGEWQLIGNLKRKSREKVDMLTHLAFIGMPGKKNIIYYRYFLLFI